MKTGSRRRGILIVELLAYMAVLFVVVTVAWLAYYRCVEHSLGVVRVAEDVARALRAGEQWREDVRQAVAAPRLADGELTIPTQGGQIRYRFAKGTVARKLAGDWEPFLPKVEASRMVLDEGQFVDSWRWEVELASRRKHRVRPLFTFRAVPGSAR